MSNTRKAPVKLPAEALPQPPARRPFARRANPDFVSGVGNPQSPYMLTDKGLEYVQLLSRNGHSHASVADALGVSVDALRSLTTRQPEVGEALSRGRGGLVTELVGHLLQKARAGDTVAILFGLKTLGGFKEGTTAEAPPTKNLTQVNINLNAPMSQAEFEAITHGVTKALPK